MIVIYPGSTETHEFVLPYASSLIQKAVVTYKQENAVRLEVEVDSVTALSPATCKISYTLTQAQSLQLRNGVPCKIQINLYTTYGNRLISRPIRVAVGEQFHRMQILDE